MKTTKTWLFLAVSLVLIGCLLFAGIMARLHWDFTKLSTVSYETTTHDINESFDSISLHTDTADIVLSPSENGTCTVECFEEAQAKHSVTVENGTLIVSLTEEKAWDDWIGLNLSTPSITIYLPNAQYASLYLDGQTGDIEIPEDFTFRDVDLSFSTGDIDFHAAASGMVKMKTTTGDIHAEHTTVGALDLSVSTGKTVLTDISCKSVISYGNTGDIDLNRVIAADTIFIERSTGDVSFDGCDAEEIIVKTDTGDVTGSFLTEKVFTTQTHTGDIHVPNSTSGGRCEIITDTGDIKIAID